MPIQILPYVDRGPSIGQRLAGGLGRALEAGQQAFTQHEQAKALREIGIPENLPQNMQQILLSERLKNESMQNKKAQDLALGMKDYETIQDKFGKSFADIWKAAPVGGRTELLKHAIDAVERGADLEDLLGGVKSPEKPKINKTEEWPDFTKRPPGYTPKDWADEQKTWRKENAPIFEANNTRLSGLERDLLDVKNLNKLNKSKKLPEGFERFILNPETGEPYGIAQLKGLSPETQEWIKTIARFQNRAKDAFGSRVTNFDLVSYMKQFPGLLNTSEGRERILKMMDINFNLDKLYADSLKKIYQKYGLRGIPQEEADRLATDRIKDKVEELRNEYVGLDERNVNQMGLSGQMVDVIGPDGQVYEVDQSEVGNLPEGYRLQ